MGNMQCPAEDAARLASVARDICPFPNYNPSPLFSEMLTINSSLHLRNHYMAVQSSLTPKQLEDFTQHLRTTFGREGKVTLGGVGVVALALAVLFDTLAKQVRGEQVSDSGPIPGLFVKDLRGYYSPQIYTISEYLRLVPHIVNNPIRMKMETERYIKLLRTDKKTVEEEMSRRGNDITGVNAMLGELFLDRLGIYLFHITNSTAVNETIESVTGGNPVPRQGTTETEVDAAHVSKTRKRRITAPENIVTFNLNCDPEAASHIFLAEVQKSNDTLEAFKQCQPFNGHIPKTWLHFIARLVWLDVIQGPLFNFEVESESLKAQREHFDLKANALGKWSE
ncbi:hypothetical protein L3Q82_006266 [Scortum barcoo]|uniref:Uncharacterized protein n=1 Tax=Scortum barcoo TaxID=214431 RepID=A0ACB8X395_9TELE|nr:hypothetical protein L3Q82_006266 [Scortum barcoo]